jgi:hypothetical protein
VFFDAVRADVANCGSRPRLFAPLSWQPGSSFSHLDEDTYPSTDVESLLTPVFDPGEVHHTVGRITRGIFSDLGWNVVNDTPAFPCLAPVAFGNVFTRGTVTGNAVLTNVGGQPLTVTGGVAPAPPFSATPPTNPTIVNAGQSIAIPVQFDATTLGFYSSSLTITTLSGNPSAAVTGAARSHTDTESFVDAAYFDFLGRLPSSGELSYWSGQLESGQTSRNGFLNLLSTSNEWVNAIVTDFYWKTLGRMPDASGLSYWTGVIQNRTLTVAQVAAQFYASNEYYNGFGGGTDSGWVHDLYIKILHREPDSTGLNYWVGVTQQQGRVAVAYAFYQSSESAHDRVADLYSKLLGRAPDTAGWDYWSQIVVTYGDLTLATTLAGSAEYAQRAITRFL